MVIRSVLCPVDFSEASRAALHAAVRLARHFSASLHVLFVEDPLLASAAASSPGVTDLKEELKPEIDVFEKDSRLVTKIDRPGMKKEDVKATCADGVLEVSVPLPAKPEAKARTVEIQEPAKAAKTAA